MNVICCILLVGLFLYYLVVFLGVECGCNKINYKFNLKIFIVWININILERGIFVNFGFLIRV